MPPKKAATKQRTNPARAAKKTSTAAASTRVGKTTRTATRAAKPKTTAAATTTATAPAVAQPPRLRYQFGNMPPSAYNAAALLPVAYMYVPDYALARLLMSSSGLGNYYPRANEVLQQEIAAGNGARWTRSAGFGPLNVGQQLLDDDDAAAAAGGLGGHCAFATLALELKEEIFGHMLGDVRNPYMSFGAQHYSTNLQSLFTLATTNKAFRTEVFAFMAERMYVVANVHFYMLFHHGSVPFMPRSHATVIKQVTIGIDTMRHLNWYPYFSKACMPRLEKLLIMWPAVNCTEGANDGHTNFLSRHMALSQMSLDLSRLCHRARPHTASWCWMWELVEGGRRDFAIQVAVPVHIMRLRGPGDGLFAYPPMDRYRYTISYLVELVRDARGRVLDDPFRWKMTRISEQQRELLLPVGKAVWAAPSQTPS